MILGRLPHEIDDLDPSHFVSLAAYLPDAWNDLHGGGNRRRGRQNNMSGEPLPAIVTNRYQDKPFEDGVAPSPAMLAMVRSGKTIRVRHASQIQSLAAAIRTIEQEKAGG